jgi:hypothetical protein
MKSTLQTVVIVAIALTTLTGCTNQPTADDRAEAVKHASMAYKLDPDLVNIVLRFEPQAASPQQTAQRLREMLERYNFDLIWALAAYKIGPEQVSGDSDIPTKARPFVASVVTSFNMMKTAEAKTAARAACRTDAQTRLDELKSLASKVDCGSFMDAPVGIKHCAAERDIQESIAFEHSQLDNCTK